MRLQVILPGYRMFCDSTWLEVHLGFLTRDFWSWLKWAVPHLCTPPRIYFMSLGVRLLILEGTSHECQVLMETRKGHCKSWAWNYRWLIASLRVLRSKSRTSGRTSSALTCWEVFQTPPQPPPCSLYNHSSSCTLRSWHNLFAIYCRHFLCRGRHAICMKARKPSTMIPRVTTFIKKKRTFLWPWGYLQT